MSGNTNQNKEEKWLYLECYSGISGDMTVGALLDLGASRKVLEDTLASLGVEGYHLHFGRKLKCGIDAYDFDVHLEDGADHGHGEDGHDHNHGDGHNHDHAYNYDHDHDHNHDHNHDHGHDHAHTHDHDHGHPHIHRNIHDIVSIIDRMNAGEPVKDLAKKMFQIVAEAESKAHGLPIEEVHFHEVGAVDSIVDIISVAVCLHDLGITKVAVSSLAEGKGYVRCQHGVMPVPVPATANIAAAHGLELKLTDNDGEMVTPTGAAIAAALRTEEELPERYVIEKIGVGAGNKDFKNANILRAMLIRPTEDNRHKPVKNRQDTGENQQNTEERLWILETNMDDCTGEALGFVMECLMEEGARDVWYTPAYMKKNRPAYVLRILCTVDKREAMEAAVFAHTTTIGIRRWPVERTVLEREVRRVETRYGVADVKVSRSAGVEYFYPEYESVRRICREQGLAFTEVYHALKEDAHE
ncbi:nickel pincer cofactor biosynthesis protein LarC [Clostridium transplantifaecale]|uniref:nickel pincer cofactor biosynthesis protein LarC n=1 Tax=Clostridium transplantifaecale TaxID=2479838 RepID=UPI000F63CBBC|nr:nickel pincer cofactor biosynthesis protein LarC [Clostridium transplantifaecale]